MTGALAALVFLACALLASLLTGTARTTGRLLLGTVICSTGLGLAVQISSGGYFGLMMIAAFLVTDLLVYLYFRSQRILPERAARNHRLDRVFRIFFLWMAFCAIAASGLLLAGSDAAWLARSVEASGISALHDGIWGSDWLLVFVPLLSLSALVIGGFFLVRRDR